MSLAEQSSATALPGEPVTAASGARRIGGVDVARALAIFGMVTVHFGPFPVVVDDGLSLAYSLPHGKAAILFVLLAGVGVSLLAGDRSARRRRSTVLRLLFRAAVLLPVGLLLQLLPHGIAVILQYYAVYFLFGVAALWLSDRPLLGAALGTVVVGPLLILAGTLAQPDWFAGGGNVSVTEPARLARALLLTGYYPAPSWVPVLWFGMWLGRRDLRAEAVRAWMVLGGVAVAAATYGGSALLSAVYGSSPREAPDWRLLLTSAAHTEMPLSVVGAAAVGAVVLGVTLAVTDRFPRLTWPLVATGQLALTIYVGHLLVLAGVTELLRFPTVEGAATSVLRFALVCIALATAWRAFFPRGPLEALLQLPTLGRDRRA